jgi:pantetheine-phosphate adenylyltransferase/dephospho-CoA kinase
MPIAVYPGSLDPITFGHTSAIRNAARFCGNVLVSIGINPSKNYTFSLAEREHLARVATADIPGVSVTSFQGLLVHFLARNGLDLVVRGVRDGSDLSEAEMQDKLGQTQIMARRIASAYIPADSEHRFTSSSALKAILKDQGDAVPLAPLSTIHATQARMLGQYFYGITGASGVGKSEISRRFQKIAEQRNILLFHVDLDKFGHDILGAAPEPIYRNTRAQVVQAFGIDILDQNGSINRKKLGEKVFGDPDKLKRLNGIIHEPIFFRMNDTLRGRKGIFLIDTALLAETSRTSLVNNQIMLVDTDQSEVATRLVRRDDLTAEQIERRISSQFTTAAKLSTIQTSIEAASYGRVECITNNRQLTDDVVEKAFDAMLNQIDIFGELRIKGFFKSIGVPNPEVAYDTLRKLYAGDDRFYHAFSHIVDGLNLISGFKGHIQDINGFVLGWLFHDAVYDSRAKDNEEKSAQLMEQLATSWGVEDTLIQRAKRFVMVTKHGVVKPQTSDEQFLVDLDMSIIGRSAPVYDLYEQNVRRDYAWVSTPDWIARRGNGFLSNLAAPYFHTEYFRERFATSAAANIKRALANLAKMECV